MKRILTLLLLLSFTVALAEADETNSAIAVNALGQSLQQYYEGKTQDSYSLPVQSSAPYIPANLKPDKGALSSAVIGRDERETISQTAVYPYSAIGYMSCHADCGCHWTGSCFMVGAKSAVTAAHCMVCTTHGNTLDRLEIFFGFQPSGKSLYHYTKGTVYWYGTDFMQQDGSYQYTWDNSLWDYAYIKLEEDVGSRTGWFGISSTVASGYSNKSTQSYWVTGYRDGVMKSARSQLELYDPLMFRYDADTEPGNSGCPVYSSDYYAVGINVSTATWDEDVYNCARRFTGDLIRDMEADGMFL
jgi:V8-like Glu-specific endopeptidase